MLLNNLSDIFKYQEIKCSCFASILEAKKYPKTKHSSNFSYKLNLIDESLKIKSQNVSVYLYFDVKNSLPFIFNIGDIVYLVNYNFQKNLIDPTTLKGSATTESNFFIFDEITSNNSQILSVSITDIPNGFYEFNYRLQQRIIELQKWKNTYFAINSLIGLKWRNFSNEYSKDLKQNFDLILKFESKSNVNERMAEYKFSDSQKKVYSLKYFDLNLISGDVIKLISLSEINQNLELITNRGSTIIRIPINFYDAKNFSEIEYVLIEETNQFKIPNNSIIRSSVKLKYLNQMVDSINLKDLIDEDYKINMNNKFMVECYVIEIFPSDFPKIIKKFCSTCKMLFDFEIDAYYCCFNILMNILQMTIMVKDASIENENIMVPLYIFSYDENPSNILPGIKLNQIKKQNLEECQSKLDSLRKNLIQNTSIDNPLKFIVEPYENEKSRLFRIIDTIFI